MVDAARRRPAAGGTGHNFPLRRRRRRGGSEGRNVENLGAGVRERDPGAGSSGG